ncbi:iron-siderophore ABC transporter substrate-binding protein [uncultured Microbacterium sp.]|uniref:iron-siderophore ABC transporter substrate-binding protein n=1 Tax=uncultured Microbacterium sp. TaxID=191216 RepID=UPI002615E9A7|nr:iron-siderophore ABC transporter substrate-binding protein [uncultured Microbacterium sp.]
MSRIRTAAALAAGAALLLSGCASPAATDGSSTPGAAGDAAFPVTITHALGETTIESTPERVATIAWGNQDVALALGVVPVGIDSQVWAWSGAADQGVYEWTSEKLDELGADMPVLFDVTDGLDFEAISDTTPDVILAAQSGLTAEDYATLSDIAPVVAYPEIPWFTPWRDQITINAQALGLSEEGDALVADLETQIADATADAGLEGKTAAFFYANPTDLSTVSLYTGGDSRTAFLKDLGFDLPQVAIDAAEEGSFYLDFSAENADQLADVDVIVTYGDDTLLAAMRADPLWSTLPAVQNGAVVAVGEGDAFSAAVTPTALSIPWVLSDYVSVLTEAAAKVQ